MKTRYRLICRGSRGGKYYCIDSATGKRTSLRTTSEDEARQLVEAKNNSQRQPVLNLQIARAYLSASDPAFVKRTWQHVMDEIQTHGRASTQIRYVRGMKSRAFDDIRHKKLLETTAEDFFAILKSEQMSVGHYLRRLHNLALSLGWLPLPVLAPRLWPKPRCKPKRGITLTEHQRILETEQNAERNLYYQLLWEVGASQSDAAALTAENMDWNSRTLTYFRMKTGERAQMAIGNRLAAILNQLPTIGPLFPTIFASEARFRAAEFRRRCKLIGIQGVSLHSYRYAWAERAKIAGMPERFAQEALGHNSKAVHRAYAKRALVRIPSLDNYEQRAVADSDLTNT
jgi:integrase